MNSISCNWIYPIKVVLDLLFITSFTTDCGLKCIRWGAANSAVVWGENCRVEVRSNYGSKQQNKLTWVLINGCMCICLLLTWEIQCMMKTYVPRMESEIAEWNNRKCERKCRFLGKKRIWIYFQDLSSNKIRECFEMIEGDL